MPDRLLEVLEEKVGESYVTIEGFEVEAGKVEEFARAVGDDDPAYRDEDVATERGFDGVPAPLTFTRVAFFPRYRPERIDEIRPFDLGFDPQHTVHGEQEYEFERVVQVGDVLTGTITLTDVYQREGSRGGSMIFAEFEIEYHDGDGELVITERTTIIETGAEEEDQG